jgi:uncharacterized protein (UPF0147 family)
MNAYELADELDQVLQVSGCDNRVPRMLRQQADRIAKLESYLEAYKTRVAELETVLQSIANEPIELSHDKIKWQCQDHIRWAKDILK